MTRKDTHSQTVEMSNERSTNFPSHGFVRLKSILAPHGPLPISKSGFWAAVKAGKYPKPLKVSPRVTVWRVEDINQLLADIERGKNS